MTYTLYLSYDIDIELLEHYQVSAENPEKPVLGTSRGMAGEWGSVPWRIPLISFLSTCSCCPYSYTLEFAGEPGTAWEVEF